MTFKTNKMTELRGSVIAIVCNSFAGCDTLESLEKASEAAKNRVLKGLTAMTNSQVFSTDEVEQLSDFATGYIQLMYDRTKERVVEELRDKFEF